MSTPTPITDRLASAAIDFVRNAKVIHVSHARRLETDRSALMEALAGLLGISENVLPLGSFGEKAKSALSAARANFPES